MGGRWGREALLSTLLTCLYLGPGLCSETDIKESLGAEECYKYGDKILWISGKTSALIVGKSYNPPVTKCQLKFGLATSVRNARLRLFFDHLYIEDCGVYLQINQSVNSGFPSKMNQEMFFSACNTKNPGPLYAQPRNFVLINLFKESRDLEAFNFRLNISLAEELPTTGIDFHIILIVGFVMAVLVGMAAVLLYKFASRLSYNWREQRVEEAMTRAINIYNSREPIEEPDLVYIRPGGDDTIQERRPSDNQPRRSQPSSSEIAFVHPDGRMERFRPRDERGRVRKEAPSRSTPNVPKGQTRRAVLEPRTPRCLLESDEQSALSQPAIVDLDSVPPRVQIPDIGDTASLGGCDMPPSYEEALEMPAPSGTADSEVSSEAAIEEGGDENIAITGRLELEVDYMNVDQNVQNHDAFGADCRERVEEDSEACDSREALLSITKRDKLS